MFMKTNLRFWGRASKHHGIPSNAYRGTSLTRSSNLPRTTVGPWAYAYGRVLGAGTSSTISDWVSCQRFRGFFVIFTNSCQGSGFGIKLLPIKNAWAPNLTWFVCRARCKMPGDSVASGVTSSCSSAAATHRESVSFRGIFTPLGDFVILSI